jgi:hypothetical protein
MQGVIQGFGVLICGFVAYPRHGGTPMHAALPFLLCILWLTAHGMITNRALRPPCARSCTLAHCVHNNNNRSLALASTTRTCAPTRWTQCVSPLPRLLPAWMPH